MFEKQYFCDDRTPINGCYGNHLRTLCALAQVWTPVIPLVK